MKYFTENTKFLRLKSGYTQAKIASSLGISRTTWIGYETGLSQPNLSGLLNIVKLFDTTATDLLEKDLQNVHLNNNEVRESEAEYVHLNVHPNVHLNKKKAQKEPCQECITKEGLIAQKDKELILNSKVIAAQEVTIQLLQNTIETMKFERREAAETQYTPREERKSA